MASSDIEDVLIRLAKVEDQLGIVLFMLNNNQGKKGLLNINDWNPQVILSQTAVVAAAPVSSVEVEPVTTKNDNQQNIQNEDEIHMAEIIYKQEFDLNNSSEEGYDVDFSPSDDAIGDYDGEHSSNDENMPSLELQVLPTIEQGENDMVLSSSTGGSSKKDLKDDNSLGDLKEISKSPPRKVSRIQIKKTKKKTKTISTCSICSKTFSDAWTMRRHHFLAHVKGNKCSTCNAVFESFNQLRAHIIASHSSAKHNFNCQFCGLAYSSRPSLLSHKRKQHSNLNKKVPKNNKESIKASHKCETCGKIVQTAWSLKRHINLLHNKQTKKLICPYCNKLYQTSTSLKYHISLAHYLDGGQQSQQEET